MIPAGWYTDPATGKPRWWDGSRWAAPSLYSGQRDAASGHNSAATWGMVLGIVSCVMPIVWISLVMGVGAIVWSGIGLSRSRNVGGKGKGPAIAGLACGIFAVAMSVAVTLVRMVL